MSNFFTEVIQKDSRYNSLECIKDLNLLEPNFRKMVAKFIETAASMGHTLKVIETFRSRHRQAYLFSKHLSQLKNVGVHGYGLAVDLGLFKEGRYDVTGNDYRFFQEIAEKHNVVTGLISGIDWGEPHSYSSFHDFDHLQAIPVFRQKELFAGTWYPPETGYDPYEDIAMHNRHIQIDEV